MTQHTASDLKSPRKWGILGATFWVFVAFFVPQFLLFPFLTIIEGWSVEENTKQFILQGIIELASVGILWLVLRYIYRSSLKDIGLGQFKLDMTGWAVLAFPLYLIASMLATAIASRLLSFDATQAQDIGYSNPDGFGLVLIFVALVCLAPFVEELLFRGFLFSAFRRACGFWVGALVVSLLFAIAHGQVNVGVDVFVLSMFLCYLREKTGSLWPSIALHATKNLVAFIILFIIHVK